MQSSPPVAPITTIHGSADLLEQYGNVRAFVLQLLNAMENAGPNGRDYYPQGPAAYQAAVDDRLPVLKAVDALAKQLDWLSIPEEDRPAVESSGFSALAELAPEAPRMVPTIHLNGTSPGELRESCKEVFRQANQLIEEFRVLAPNGRDYNPENWEAARKQHHERVFFIKKVAGYYLQLAMATRQKDAPSVSSPGRTESATPPTPVPVSTPQAPMRPAVKPGQWVELRTGGSESGPITEFAEVVSIESAGTEGETWTVTTLDKRQLSQCNPADATLCTAVQAEYLRKQAHPAEHSVSQKPKPFVAGEQISFLDEILSGPTTGNRGPSL